MPDNFQLSDEHLLSSIPKTERSARGKWGRVYRGRSRSRGRGRSSASTSDQEFGYDSRSHSGTDNESIDSLSFGSPYCPSTPLGQTTSLKIQDVTKLERLNSPVASLTPKGTVMEIKRERVESVDRPDSRTSSYSQSSRGERDQEALRKRRDLSPLAKSSKRSKTVKSTDEELEKEAGKGANRKKTASQKLYVPRSKRNKEETSELSNLDAKKSVFDRLGPTKSQEVDNYQRETFGEVILKRTKPSDTSPAKSPPRGESRLSSVSSEKCGTTVASSDETKKDKVASSEREEKDRSSRHSSSDKGKDSESSRRSSDKVRKKKEVKGRVSSKKIKEMTTEGDLLRGTRIEAPTALTQTPSGNLDDPGTPPPPPEDLEQQTLIQEQMVPHYDPVQLAAWIEFYRLREQEQHIEATQATSHDLGGTGATDTSKECRAIDVGMVASSGSSKTGKKKRVSSSKDDRPDRKRMRFDTTAAYAILHVRIFLFPHHYHVFTICSSRASFFLFLGV